MSVQLYMNKKLILFVKIHFWGQRKLIFKRKYKNWERKSGSLEDFQNSVGLCDVTGHRPEEVGETFAV
jgi:hypothetical protein